MDCFLSSGAAALRGENPYAAYAIHYSSKEEPSFNLNAPVTLLVFAPLSKFNLYDFHPYWIISSIFSLFIAVVLLVQSYKPKISLILVIFALSSFGDTLAVGNLYFFLLLIITSAWILIENKQTGWAGVMIGLLVAIKPNFFIWPLFLLLNKDYKTSISSLISAAVFLSIPVMIWGPSIYTNWLKLISTEPYFLHPLNISIIGIALRFHLQWLRLPLMAMIIGSAMTWVIWNKPKPNTLHGIALLTSLLASPLIWPTYSILLTPIFLSFPFPRKLLISVLIFLIPTGPFNLLQFSKPVMTGWFSLLLSFGLLLIVWNLMQEKHFFIQEQKQLVIQSKEPK